MKRLTAAPQHEAPRTENIAPGAAEGQHELPVPTVSAVIERGVKTNRVRRVRKPKEPEAPVRYRYDRSVRGKGAKVIAISLPADELAEMDAFAARVQMARSHLIRQAVKHFRVKVLG